MKKIIISIILVTLVLLITGVIYFNNRAQLEKEQMFEVATDYIKKYSVEDMEVELKVIKQLDKWALLEATPINIETDSVGVIIEKVDGIWVARDFGTILPDWEKKVPELFE